MQTLPETTCEPAGGDALTNCEVLVVGAGPTGLIAADLLRRAGVDVRIVDMRREATRESRAFAVQARTLELMQSLDLADEFLARGVMTTGVDVYVRGKLRGGPDTDRAGAVDTPFSYILMIPQSETEAILIDDLARLGVTVERGMEVTGVTQDADGASVTLRDTDGDMSSIRCAYVLGADGSRSVVRSAAGLPFKGDTYSQSFLLADCKVDWSLDHTRFRVFINGRRIGLFLPLAGSELSRVMTTDFSDEDGDATEDLPLELGAMQGAFVEAAGIPATLSNPVWVTRYRAHHRAVDRYRAGRLFVAGDAAHIHSPAGGQGMNTGLQDAANLAWKLAAVLTRGADDALLDNYHDERKPVGELVVKSTGKLFSAAAGQSGIKATLRDFAAMVMLPAISRAPAFHRKAFLGISERNISYPPGPFVAEDSHATNGGPRPGERAPNVRVNAEQSLFDLLKGFRFTVLVLSRRPIDPSECRQIRGLLDTLTQDFPHVNAHLIARVTKGRDSNVVFANGPDVFDSYGITGGKYDQATYLVRPDNYVAWRAVGFELGQCRQFLEHFGVHSPAATRISTGASASNPHA